MLIVILAALGASATIFRGAIPPPPTNSLAPEAATYLTAGSREPIDWYPLGRAAFEEAARTDRLIMLAIGTPASRAARAADLSAFVDLELAEELRQSFVSIRVDLFDMPPWQNAYFPISRAQIGMDPSFQIWILDPKASVFNWFLRRSPSERADGYTVLQLLRESRRDIATILSGKSDVLAPGEAQRLDIVAGRDASKRRFDVDAQLNWLASHIHPVFGGIVSDPAIKVDEGLAQVFQRPQPQAWRLLMQKDRIDLAAKSMDPMLLSPIVDWVGGGFYRQANRLDWRDVEADQYARITAETMAVLALRWRIDGDPLSKLLAERAFDALTNTFLRDGLTACYASSNESYFGRNDSASFGPRRMRALFSAEEREWLRTNLDLRVETNPQMIPSLLSRRTILQDREKLIEMLGRMQDDSQQAERSFGRNDYANVNGYVRARMIEAALLLGDGRRILSARSLFVAMRKFRVGPDDVVHSLAGDRGSSACLADYLGYADAALQESLASGDPTSAKDGLIILNRALFRFYSQIEGVYFDGMIDADDPWPSDILTPDFCDDMGESSSAALARLCVQYSRYARVAGIGDKGDPERLHRIARQIVDHAEPLMGALRMLGSGLACAANMLEEPWYASVGSEFSDARKELQERFPNRTVYCVRRSAIVKNGTYVSAGGELLTPLD